MLQWVNITKDHMKTDGLKNPSVCFYVISDDGVPPKHVGSLINGIYFFNSLSTCWYF